MIAAKKLDELHAQNFTQAKALATPLQNPK
jgi:hypothetical protein